MKIALITTTINVPKVLALYRKLGPDVRFFVAGDHKTPHQALGDFLDTVGRKGDVEEASEQYYHPTDQQGLNYKSSELIGWNTVRRRNIALLEALKWGAEIIVTIDDDNIPINEPVGGPYFWWMARVFGAYTDDWEFHGIKASSPSGWFDAGQLLIPQTPHRGFPHAKKAQPVYESIVDAKVGVAAGLCLGDPDIDATTRIVNAPVVHGVSELARAGVVTDPHETWTVFNTQNTAFIRELAPAMFCAPGLGRFDDIFASLITQRVMAERDLHVHFGQPFVWQQRNMHNLLRDLQEEVQGMLTIEQFAKFLGSVSLRSSTVIEQCREIWLALDHVPNSYDIVHSDTAKCALAFLEDCGQVL